MARAGAMAAQRVEEPHYPTAGAASLALDQDLEGLPRAERTRMLLAAVTSASPSERTALEERVIEANLVIAEQLAARYRQRGVPDDDLKQVASRPWSRRFDATSTPRTVTSCRSPSRRFAASSAGTSATSGGPSGRQDLSRRRKPASPAPKASYSRGSAAHHGPARSPNTSTSTSTWSSKHCRQTGASPPVRSNRRCRPTRGM